MPPRIRDDEAVLARLASAGKRGEAGFLSAHHLAAADRLEKLIRLAQLTPRLTMSYDPTRLGGRSDRSPGRDSASDASARARLALSRLAGLLPADCWGVLFDVCGLGKGLQLIETERRWPRRSAKLVLRIGLEQLAAQFGLSPHRADSAAKPMRGWLEQRLPLIGEEAP